MLSASNRQDSKFAQNREEGGLFQFLSIPATDILILFEFMEEAKGIIRTVATAQDPSLVRCFRGHQKTINAIDFSSDMKQVASASSDGLVHIWSFKPQARPFKFHSHVGPVHDVLFTADNSKIISCGEDRQIKFWKNSVQGKCSSIKAHSGPILKLCLSQKESSFLVSCSSDKTIKMWNLQGKFKQSYLGHNNWVRQVDIAPDQRLMLSCSDDKTVKIWDLQKSSSVITFNDHKDAVLSCKFSPDGTCAVGSGIDGTIKVWDVRNNKLIQHYNAGSKAVNSVSFHPYGYHLCSVSDQGKIKVWQMKEGRLGWTLYGHTGAVKAVNFCEKGDYFATGGQDNLVMIWKSNFDVGLGIPNRVNSSNYIQKGNNQLQPLFKSNKNIVQTEIVHGQLQKIERIEGRVDNREALKPQYFDPSANKGGKSQGQTNPEGQTINTVILAQMLAPNLEKLVSQLDLVTRSITTLDNKLAHQQKTISSLFQHPKIVDCLQQYEDSDKMRPEVYESVWEAFRREEGQASRSSRRQQLNQYEGDPVMEDLANQLQRINMVTDTRLQSGKEITFKRAIEEEIRFDEQEIESS